MAYLVEHSTKGGAMHLSSHGATGGVTAGDATNDTIGPKANEAPPVIAVATTSRPMVASASAISKASRRGAREVGCLDSTLTKGS